MAPRAGERSPDSPPEGAAPDGFWSRFCGLPVVRSTHDLYETTKGKYELLGFSLDLLEVCVSVVSEPVRGLAQKIPGTSALDTLACRCLGKVEDTLSVVIQFPRQVARSVQHCAVTTYQSGVRALLRTRPGRATIRALESAIAWSEDRLDKAEDADSGGVAKATVWKTLQKYDISLPLEASVSVLRLTKRTVVASAGLQNVACQDPDAKPRKKVTPMKRLPRKGVFAKITGSALSFLGIRIHQHKDCHVKLNLDSADKGVNPAGTSDQHKRKYDELCLSDVDWDYVDIEKALDMCDAPAQDPGHKPSSPKSKSE